MNEVQDQLKDELKEHVDSIVSTASSMETRIREKVEKDIDVKIQERVDDELAKLGPYMRSEDGIISDTPFGGTFEVGTDIVGGIAGAAQELLSKTWMPIRVETDVDGEVTEQSVKEATTNFLLGNPIFGVEAEGTDDDELLQAMQASEGKARTDPHAKAMINTVKHYTVGNGIKLDCTVDKVRRHIDEYWNMSAMSSKIKQAVPRRWLFGEHYFLHFISASGDVRTRDRTKPFEISHIETSREDGEVRLAYGRSDPGGQSKDGVNWFADINYFDQLEGAFPYRSVVHKKLKEDRLMQMVKFGDSSSKRGIPALYSALRFFTYYEHFVLDRIVLNHERSKVVWIKKISGNRGVEKGRAQLGPRSGQILYETSNVSWRTENPNINADDVKEDARLIRLTMCYAANMPEHIVFQDASNEVYASIRSQDTPFSQFIISEQADWGFTIKEMIRFVLKKKVEKRVLPKKTNVELYTTESMNQIYDEVEPMISSGANKEDIIDTIEVLASGIPTKKARINTEDVLVDVNFPQVVQPDPLKLAQESEILGRSKLASKHTLSARHGLRFDEEIRLMASEKDQFNSFGEDPSAGSPRQSQGKPLLNDPADADNDKPREE